VLEFQGDLGADGARYEPVDRLQALALHSLVVHAEKDVAHANLPTQSGWRTRDDFADIDPATSLLIPVGGQRSVAWRSRSARE
jgi:hypothetical protein